MQLTDATQRTRSLNFTPSCLPLRPVNDTMDDIFEESGDEEESQDIVNQVLDEIGIEISGKVRRQTQRPLRFFRTLLIFTSLQQRNANIKRLAWIFTLLLPCKCAPAATQWGSPSALPAVLCVCLAAQMPCVWLPLRAIMSYYPS